MTATYLIVAVELHSKVRYDNGYDNEWCTYALHTFCQANRASSQSASNVATLNGPALSLCYTSLLCVYRLEDNWPVLK